MIAAAGAEPGGRRVASRLLSTEELDLLYEHVRAAGWRSGFASFLNAVDPARSQAIAAFNAADNGGWKYLVALSRDLRAVVLETGLGGTTLSLSREVAEVHCAHFDTRKVECLSHRLREGGATNVRCVALDDIAHWPYESGSVDLVVCHRIEEWLSVLEKAGTGGRATPSAALELIVREARRVLADTGQIFISFRNGWSYVDIARAFGRMRGPAGGAVADRRVGGGTVRRARATLRRSGFPGILGYFAFPSLTPIEDISDGSASVGGACRLGVKAALAQVVRRRPWVRWFAPGVLLVGSRVPVTNRLGEIAREVGTGGERLQVTRYRITGSNKVILELVPKGTSGDGAVVKIPLDGVAEKRCETNAAALRMLNSCRTILSTRVPTVRRRSKSYGAPYYVESIVPGVALDRPVRSFDTVVCEAALLLQAFHRDSSQPERVDDRLFSRLVGEPMRALRESCIPRDLSAAVDAVEQALRGTLFGKTLPLVWQHGDFKLENVLVDPRSLHVVGIIDWELSEPHGLPLLDLFHLLVHRDRVTRARPTHVAIREKALRLDLDEFEHSLVGRYAGELGVAPEVVPALAILYWTYHIVFRITPAAKRLEHWLKANVRDSLDTILDGHLWALRPYPGAYSTSALRGER